jgi:hypothetical protein
MNFFSLLTVPSNILIIVVNQLRQKLKLLVEIIEIWYLNVPSWTKNRYTLSYAESQIIFRRMEAKMIKVSTTWHMFG